MPSSAILALGPGSCWLGSPPRAALSGVRPMRGGDAGTDELSPLQAKDSSARRELSWLCRHCGQQPIPKRAGGDVFSWGLSRHPPLCRATLNTEPSSGISFCPRVKGGMLHRTAKLQTAVSTLGWIRAAAKCERAARRQPSGQRWLLSLDVRQSRS